MEDGNPEVDRRQAGLLARLLTFVIGQTGLGRFVRFGLVGLSGTGVNVGTFWLLTRIAHCSDLVAIVFGYIAATLSNFVLNDFWTFKDRRTQGAEAMMTRLARFCVVSGVAIGIYYAIYTPLTRFLDVYDLLALGTAIIVGMAWNFSVNFLWTWRKRGREAQSEN